MLTTTVLRIHLKMLVLLVMTGIPIIANAQLLPACPTVFNTNVDPRRSLMVTEVDVINNAISLGEVMDKLALDSGIQNLDRDQLWAQWWDTQNPGPGLGSGSNCNDHIDTNGMATLNGFPLDCPRNEGSEISHNPFDPDQPGFYYPIALINRLDLAPEDGTNCGEYRVIFARDPEAGEGRNLLIFEAVMPNPNPGCGIDGCRAIATFWARLSRVIDPQIRARMLHDFYFRGLPAAGVEPVIHAQHFSPGSGQIRTNQFMSGSNAQIWQLREFKLALIPGEAGAENELLFVPVSTKGTPWGGLFDQGSGHALTTSFMRHFMTQLDELDEDRITKISNAVPRQYNSGQSTEAPFSESDYPIHFDPNGAFANAIQVRLDRLNSTLTSEDVVRRARTQNCAGCHQLSNNDNIGDGLVWPASLGFVHVHEQVTENINGTEHFVLSPALLEEFLPHRERVFEAYLREDCQPCRRSLTRSGRSFDIPEMSPVFFPSDLSIPLGAWIEDLDAELKASWPNDTLGGPTPTH